MPTVSHTLDRDDIQGLVLRGYRMPVAAFLCYRFGSESGARSWLAGLIDPVTTAAEWDAKPPWCANVALTYPALEVLGVPTESLASFPEDFRQGMAARAATALGDVADDLPENWERDPPFASRGVHAMLLIWARDRQELDRRVEVLGGQATATNNVEPVGSQYAAALDDDKVDTEHFGFRDGISQPVLVGSGLDAGAADQRTPVAPGEFVLGHSDELGNTPMPFPEALGRNGTYAVYRKLHQDVAAFRGFLDGSDDGDLLAAKLMGRWRSGAPLALAKTADDPDLAADPQRNNSFDYIDDPLGYGCPRGSHVRRARARDGSVTIRRRLLLRRGLPYGSPAPEGTTGDNAERGLVGVFLNASIERQYEFVQRQWLNWAQFDGLDNDPDPITGPGGADFTWQRRPFPWKYTALPRFVTVRGGEYFFMPSITAMRFLSDGPAS